MLEWSVAALRGVAGVRADRRRAARGRGRARRARSACAGGADALARPCAPRWPPRRRRRAGHRPRRRAAAGRRPSSSTRALAELEAARRATPRSPPRRVTDTIKEAGRGRRGARARSTARRLWAVQTPQVFRARGAASARSTCADDVLAAATDDAWLVERGGRDGAHRRSPRVRTSRSRRRWTCAWPSCSSPSGLTMLTDYHVHLRPDEPGTTAERYFTAANAERYREAAAERGIAELGRRRARPPLRPVARGLGPRVVARPGASTTSTPTAPSCARRPTCGWASRPTSSPGPRGPHGHPARRPRVGLRRRLGALPRRRTRSTTTAGTSGTATPTPSRSGGATSRRSARRRAAGCSTSSPTRTSSRSGARESPRPDGDLRRFYELAMDGIAESRHRRSRSPRPACASRSASSTPTRRSWRCASTPAARSRCPATRTCPSTWASATTRRWSCSTRVGVTELCVFEGRERRLEPIGGVSPDRHRLRLAPARRTAAG